MVAICESTSGKRAPLRAISKVLSHICLDKMHMFWVWICELIGPDNSGYINMAFFDGVAA
jgi:prepilin-type processing-associated H-X9-DG protein